MDSQYEQLLIAIAVPEELVQQADSMIQRMSGELPNGVRPVVGTVSEDSDTDSGFLFVPR